MGLFEEHKLFRLVRLLAGCEETWKGRQWGQPGR